MPWRVSLPQLGFQCDVINIILKTFVFFSVWRIISANKKSHSYINMVETMPNLFGVYVNHFLRNDLKAIFFPFCDYKRGFW